MGRIRPNIAARIRGCLLGGAVGDALGAPIEFMTLDAIRARYGPSGLEEFDLAYGRIGAITDDTQMTLFTAEGLVRAKVRQASKGICHPPSVVHAAYLRWYATQRSKTVMSIEEFQKQRAPDGWLVTHRELWSRRGPGNTCLAALSRADTLGTVAENDSKGCGAIMRVAPVGLLYPSATADGASNPAFDIGKEVSACTHGNPTGYLAGAVFAQIIASIVEGHTLLAAIDAARATLRAHAHSSEVSRAIDGSLQLASKIAEPSIGDLEVLGGGWTGEEALAIALYVALVAKSFEHGVRLAVNHSGDSDSTGSLVGALLGTIHGDDVIPIRWIASLELREVIDEIACDLAAVRSASFDCEANEAKYPGW